MKTYLKSIATRAGSMTAFGLGLALMMSATAGSARAGFLAAPEVDPSSLASALTLLVGGVLTLTGRARRA